MTSILAKIKSYNKKKLIFQLSAGILNVIVMLSIIWISTVFVDMAFYFSVPSRWFVLILNVGLTLILVYIFFAKYLIKFLLINKKGNFKEITNEIGLKYPSLKDRLTNIYQLDNLTIPEYSKNLRDYASEKFSDEIKKFDFTKQLKISDFFLPKYFMSIVLISSFISIFILYEPMSLSFNRVLFPFIDFSNTPEFSFNVKPGNKRIIKGNSENIEVEYNGPKINGCFVFFKYLNDSYWQSSRMQLVGTSYLYTFEDVRQSIDYKISGVVENNRSWYDKINSSIYRLNTITPPELSDIQVEVNSPRYTNLPPKFLEKNVADVVAYKGSNFNISALINKKVQKAEIVFSDSSVSSLIIKNRKVSGKINVKKSDNYFFNIVDNGGVINQNPIVYSITILDDYFPSVNIIKPDENIESIPDAKINLQIEANDDFGFNSVSLNYKIISTEETVDSSYNIMILPISLTNLKYFSYNYLWDLSVLPIGFDETIKYFVSVTDNDNISGPKLGKSKIHFIRFPSLQKLFEDFASIEEKNVEEMEDIAQENEELKKELEKIKREFKQDQKMDWERKREIESTLNKQNELQKKVVNIEKKIEEAVKNLSDKNLLSPEVLQKYNKLQELFQEIATPELLEAMQELQKSMESVDKKKVEQALNQMEFNQKQFKENLERTLELFKKIQLEQDLDQLVQMTNKLLEKQNNITNDIKNDKPKSKIKDSQSKQSENLKSISKNSEDLLDKDLMKSFQEAWQKLNEANKISNQQKLQNQMNQIQDQLSNNNINKAQSNSQSLEEQMQMLLDKLKQSQEAMNNENKNNILAKMQKTTSNLLQMSKDEEKLMNKTRDLSNFSDDFRRLGQSQKEISENMSKVIKEIIDLSKETFFLSPKTTQSISKSYGNMSKSLNALEERNKNNASKFQNDAMSNLNEAVIEMQNNLQSMSNSNSGSGFEQFMKQMQQMAGQQGQLNQQGMEMLQKQGNSGQLTPGQQGQLARMAAQQEALRKSLEQLNKEMGNRSDILGRIDNIGDEMKKVVKDMQTLNYDRRTIERQQNILSRMLDAQKSVRERQYSRKRKAEVGKEYARKSPSELAESIDEEKAKLRKELKQALQEGYSIDYEKLIEEYFRNLNEIIEKN